MAIEQKTLDSKPRFGYESGGKIVLCHAELIGRFLVYQMAALKLGIGKYLKQLRRGDFLLIASTGLGKTVAVPLYRLYANMFDEPYPTESPRIWVVEPKIAIVQSLQVEMNRAWDAWVRETEISPTMPLFGAKTKVDHTHVEAPIMFVTTGMFGIYARNGRFKPGRDSIIIDEAHETLESEESIELGVAICRKEGVSVSYMSASVDTDGLAELLGVRIVRAEEQMHPIWMHNTKKPLEECIADLVGDALADPRTNSELFPQVKAYASVKRAALEQGRAKGMLIMINSFSGEQSDAKRIERILREAGLHHKVEIGLLASEVLRDAKRKQDYLKMIERWKREKRKYVLIATSVVEMGVTLPDLDFIVTMDSGFNAIADQPGKIVRGPLGVNSLIQRRGRVGRERPGICYVTRDEDAKYSDLSDKQLNDPHVLKPEKICFPTETSSCEQIAYYFYSKGLTNEDLLKSVHELKLAGLTLPGLLKRGRFDPVAIGRINASLKRMRKLGIAEGNLLTPLGKEITRWIGRASLDAIIEVHTGAKQSDDQEAFYGLLACAQSVTPLPIKKEDKVTKGQPPRFVTSLLYSVEEFEELRSNRLVAERRFISVVYASLDEWGIRPAEFKRFLKTLNEMTDLYTEFYPRRHPDLVEYIRRTASVLQKILK